MKTWLVGLVVCAGLIAPSAAVAGSGNHASDVQASMIVTGSIVIKPDGSVASYALDKPGKLPSGVITDVAKVVSHWTFQPVLRDGKAVMARASMTLRMVAVPVAGDKYAIGIGGARFGNGKSKAFVSKKHVTPPRYPQLARINGVSGTVYLVLQVGRDGTVQRVAARQVDLRTRGTHSQMKGWRHAFVVASIRAAKRWTFNPPVQGPHVGDPYWVAAIPVNFKLQGGRSWRPLYGQWSSYIPGPRHYVPWINHDQLASGSADVMPAGGGVYPARQALHLLSTLGNPAGNGPH